MSAAFALLSCFGAWQAWRHNPLYSSRSVLWLIAKIVLMLGATATLIAIASLLAADRSAPVRVATSHRTCALTSAARGPRTISAPWWRSRTG